jgi:hydrogenase maturation protein HypF
MQRFFRVRPSAVAHDLHPGYLSTRAAGEMNLPLIGVQHHHAHIASCMAEHRLSGKAIGVAFDGTGYGTDGAIWGGEVLVSDFAGFERRYHLRYVPLAGGDAAVREPWRVALAYLRDAQWDGPAGLSIPEAKQRLVETMLARGVQTVATSSCGRLFDAVSALLGICLETRYEAEAAMELEAAAGEAAEPFAFDLTATEIDLRQSIREIMTARDQGDGVSRIASRFHATLAAAIGEVCRRIRRADGLERVCLSGGSFQNMRLLEQTAAELENSGFTVYSHSEIPPNDGGIALGQAAVANSLVG